MVPLQLNIQEVFDFLFEEGLVYRYSAKDWPYIKKRWPGHSYPSPTRMVVDDDQEIVEELIQPTITPVVITEKEFNQLQTLTQALNLFFEATHEFAIKNGTSISRKERETMLEVMMTRIERENLTTQSGYSQLMPFVRLDCLRIESGFKIVDINSTRPAGVGEQVLLNTAFADFLEEDQISLPLESIFLDTIHECFFAWQELFGKTDPRTCIVLSDILGDYWNFKILQDLIAKDHRFGSCRLLTVNGSNSVELVRYNPIIRSRIKEGIDGYKLLTSHLPDSCCTITPLYNRWLGNKLWMYYFSGQLAGYYRSKLGENLYQALQSAFPRTGIVNSGKEIIQFPDEKISIWQLPRKQFMFKPGKGSSAKGVLFGCDANRNQWEEKLEWAPRDSIIQEYFPVKEQLVVLDERGVAIQKPLYTKYGVFILGGKLAGLELMARQSKIVHGARDTYLAPVYIQKEKGRDDLVT